MKMFVTDSFSTDIEEKEIIRQTDKKVYFIKNGRERSELKVSNYSRFFDTRQEATQFLHEKYTKKVENLKKQLAKAEQELKNLIQ